jgi:hypothetical protein
MTKRWKPRVGQEVEIEQRFRRGEVQMCDYKVAHEEATRTIIGTVHYVRKRGDYQVDIDGRRYWVDKRHTLRSSRIAGVARVKGPMREGSSRPEPTCAARS